MAPNHSHRPIKIIVISDYICSFCYIANKAIHDAIEACRDLPIRFEVEFRPFTLLCSAACIDLPMGTSRNAYFAKRFGIEQAEAKWRAVLDMAKMVGLHMAEDGVLCPSTQAHRLSVKAYQVGGQAMQQDFNSLIFDACFAKGEDISRDDFLADVAVEIGLMNRERAAEFLRSTEALDCVDKMVEAARANGVNGVPFVIIDGKWALNGVQSMDCYVQIFRKLAQSPPTKSLAGARKECKESIIAATRSGP